MILYFVRHGDPVYDPDQLTPLGHRQAEAVALRLASRGLDRVFASSSNRAIQTARPTAEILGKEIEILDWCNESYAWTDFTVKYPEGRYYWAYQSPEYRRLFNSAAMRRLGEDWATHPALAQTNIPAGVARIRRETDAFMATLGYERDGEACGWHPTGEQPARVALFAHQGFGLAFLSCLLDVPYPLFCTHFDIGHTGVTPIFFPDDGDVVFPTALEVSSDAHIYRAGLPMRYGGWIDI